MDLGCLFLLHAKRNVNVNVRLVDRSLQGLFRINRLNGIGPMHVKAPTAAAIRSMRDLGAPQTQSDIIDWESILRREENRSTRRKTLGVRLRSTESQPTYDPRPELNLGHRGGRHD